VWVLPITTKNKRIRSHVPIHPPAGGATTDAFIKCEELRAVSTDRLVKLRGTVDSKTIQEVLYAVEFFLGLR
jgi:mRNA interferase MazF